MTMTATRGAMEEYCHASKVQNDSLRNSDKLSTATLPPGSRGMNGKHGLTNRIVSFCTTEYEWIGMLGKFWNSIDMSSLSKVVATRYATVCQSTA